MELTVAQFAKKIGKDRRTIYRWIAASTPLPSPWKAKIHLTRLYVTDKDQ